MKTNFTEREFELLCRGIICLINNVNKANELVGDIDIIEQIEKTKRECLKLHTKVCEMRNITKTEER